MSRIMCENGGHHQNILFINPPAFAVFDAFRSSVTPPLNLAYLIRSLSELPLEISVLDVGLKSVQKFGEKGNNRQIERFLGGRPHREYLSFINSLLREAFKREKFGFVAMNADLYPFALYCLRQAKLLNPSSFIIIGGTTASECYGAFLDKKQVDCVVLDEGEETLPHLIECLQNGMNLDEVPGIVYKCAGSYIRNKARQAIRFDRIISPDYGLFDMETYLRLNGRRLMVLSARGCRGNCKFCGMPHHLPLRIRAAQDVVDEIEILRDRHGVSNFTFFNSMMNITPQHISDVCSELEKRRVQIRFSCYLKADRYLTRDTFRILRSSGCYAVDFGIESGSQSVLYRCSKGIELPEAIKLVGYAKAERLKIRCTFIWGFPNESWSEFLATIALYIRFRPACSGFFEFRLSESSEYYRNIERYTENFFEDIIRIRLARTPLAALIKGRIASLIQKI